MATDSENWEQLQRLFHLAAVTPEADRDQEVLPHAETAAKLLKDGSSHDAKQMDSEAQQTLREIESRLHL
jgi:hypothetical protein